MIQRPQIKFQRPILGDGKRRGIMLVISSPSGAGKTSISRKLLQMDPSITLSVSVTTRERRPNEVSGVDYYFIDEAEFGRLLQNNELLEHARVFDNCYGTPRELVEQQLSEGRDVLFDVDWQGHKQLVEKARTDVVSIFILPPSYEELNRRLHQRAQDSEEVIARRMAKAPQEIAHWAEYDYVLINEDLQETTATVQGIIEVERLKRTRQVGLADFVKRLQETRG
ncbi:MAG TPA: guanylate kinase [Azospirillaceae bacterium]|nr:guanylate kinase [Azospirillaceae bacterium]